MGNKGQKILKLANFFFAFFIIFESNTVYVSSPTPIAKKLKLLLPFIIIISIFLYSYIAKRHQIKVDFNNALKIILYFTWIMGIFLILNRFNYKYHIAHTILIYYILPVLFIIFLNILIQMKQIEPVLKNIIGITIFLSIISLIFWVIGELGFPTNSSLLLGWGYHRIIHGYFGLYYFTQEPANILGINIIRNTGIFTEAPMYGIVLTVSFILNLFYLRNNRFFSFNNIIIVLTIFTTVATSGILICFLAYLGHIYYKNKMWFIRLSRNKKIILSFTSFSIIFFILVVIFINKLKTFGGSVSIRSDDIISGFRAFLNHPIIGNGIGNNTSIKNYMANYRLIPGGNSGFSLGLLQIMVFGGIFLTFIYFIPLFKIILKRSYVDLYVMLLLLLMLSLTIINETPLFIFILLFIFMKENNYREILE